MNSNATHHVWSMLDPSSSRVLALSAFTGLEPAVAWQIQEYALALSEESAAFIDAMPQLVRSLTSTTSATSERCVGHLRGPVLWAETMTAWSSGLGVDDVFVCSIQRRDFNLAENRLLVGLLDRVAANSSTLNTAAANLLPDALRERLRSKISTAKALRANRLFASIPVQRRIDPKDLKEARRGRHHAKHRVAIDAYHAIDTALDQRWVYALSDATSRAFHLDIARWAHERGGSGKAVPQVRVIDHDLVLGTQVFRHPSDTRPAPEPREMMETPLPPTDEMSADDRQSVAEPLQRSGSYSS